MTKYTYPNILLVLEKGRRTFCVSPSFSKPHPFNNYSPYQCTVLILDIFKKVL